MQGTGQWAAAGTDPALFSLFGTSMASPSLPSGTLPSSSLSSGSLPSTALPSGALSSAMDRHGLSFSSSMTLPPLQQQQQQMGAQGSATWGQPSMDPAAAAAAAAATPSSHLRLGASTSSHLPQASEPSESVLLAALQSIQLKLQVHEQASEFQQMEKQNAALITGLLAAHQRIQELTAEVGLLQQAVEKFEMRARYTAEEQRMREQLLQQRNAQLSANNLEMERAVQQLEESLAEARQRQKELNYSNIMLSLGYPTAGPAAAATAATAVTAGGSGLPAGMTMAVGLGPPGLLPAPAGPGTPAMLPLVVPPTPAAPPVLAAGTPTGPTPSRAGASYANRKCYNCGQKGHRAGDCPNPRTRPDAGAEADKLAAAPGSTSPDASVTSPLASADSPRLPLSPPQAPPTPPGPPSLPASGAGQLPAAAAGSAAASSGGLQSEAALGAPAEAGSPATGAAGAAILAAETDGPAAAKAASVPASKAQPAELQTEQHSQPAEGPLADKAGKVDKLGAALEAFTPESPEPKNGRSDLGGDVTPHVLSPPLTPPSIWRGSLGLKSSASSLASSMEGLAVGRERDVPAPAASAALHDTTA